MTDKDNSKKRPVSDQARPDSGADEAREAQAESVQPDSDSAPAEAEEESLAPAEEEKEDPLAEAEARCAELQDRYLRTLADLDNFRRRSARERQDLIKYASADVIEGLLPVLDNLHLGLKAARNHKEAKDLVQGFELVAQQLMGILAERGLAEIDPSGAEFDPNFHDTIASQHSDSVPEGIVVQTIRVGYRLHDRLLRPASVVVSAGPAEEDKDDSAEKPEPENTAEDPSAHSKSQKKPLDPSGTGRKNR